MRSSLAFVVALAGCAAAQADRETVRYAGDPFEVRADSRFVSGQVCGMDLTLEVTRIGNAVELDGFIDGKFPVRLRGEARGDERRFQGSLGTRPGEAAVDLGVSGHGLVGRVGWRRFSLAADGDALRGTVQIAGAARPSDATLVGRGALASLPLEAATAIIPTLLACNVPNVGNWARAPLLVRVGGPAGALPRESSALYTHDR